MSHKLGVRLLGDIVELTYPDGSKVKLPGAAVRMLTAVYKRIYLSSETHH